MKKRLCAILCVLMMVLVMIPAQAFADPGDEKFTDSTLDLQFKTIKNVNAGIQVTWTANANAAKYHLEYCEDDTDNWIHVDVTGKTSYTIPKSKLTSGKDYEIRIYGEKNGVYGLSGREDEGIDYLAAPVISKTKNLNAGTQITWSAVPGAYTYSVMYKKSGGSWKTYATGITGTTYTMPKSALTRGTKYLYTVRAVGDDPDDISGYTSGKAQTYLKAPTVSSIAGTSSGVKVSWGKVTGAKTYIVMYKVSGGSWQTAKTGITGTSYTVPKSLLKSGKTYYFTVKAKGASTSGYTSGKSIKVK